MTTSGQPVLHRLRDRMDANADLFARNVFSRLFAASPALRKSFPVDMTVIGAAFVDVLDHVLDVLPGEQGHDELIELLAQYGRDNRKYGFTDLDYDHLFEALIAESAAMMGSEWTPSTADTVGQAMMLTTGVMRGAAQSVPGPAIWDAQVVQKFVINRERAVVRLKAVNDLPPYLPGQYVETRIPQCPNVWRDLSPAVPLNDSGELEFHVRAVPGGEFSNAVVKQTEPGDVWSFAQSHGTLHVDRDRPILMVAAAAAWPRSARSSSTWPVTSTIRRPGCSTAPGSQAALRPGRAEPPGRDESVAAGDRGDRRRHQPVVGARVPRPAPVGCTGDARRGRRCGGVGGGLAWTSGAGGRTGADDRPHHRPSHRGRCTARRHPARPGPLLTVPGSRSLSAAQARRITLAAQGFTSTPRPRKRRPFDPALDRMGVLQIDSVNVFARSHYLPVFSRLGDYDPAALDRLLWSSGEFTEYWAHEAAFIRLEDRPLFTFRMDDYRRKYEERLTELKPVADEVRRRLADGPQTVGQLESGPRDKRGPWWDWSDTKLAVELLFSTGEVVTVGRERFARRYALAADVLPGDAMVGVPRADAHRVLVERAARSLGVAALGDLADYYRLKSAETKAAVRDLVDEEPCSR